MFWLSSFVRDWFSMCFVLWFMVLMFVDVSIMIMLFGSVLMFIDVGVLISYFVVWEWFGGACLGFY